MSDGVRDTIHTIVSAELGLDTTDVPPSTDLRELPGLDSIKILRAVTKIEKHYDVELDDEVVFQISSVDGLAEIVEGLLADRSAENAP